MGTRTYRYEIGVDNIVRLVAPNGSAAMTSKTYSTRAAAVRAATQLSEATAGGLPVVDNGKAK